MTKRINGSVNDEKQITVDNKNPEIENYIQDEIDALIDEYDTLNTIEDRFNTMIIDVDDFNFELSCELKKRLRQLYGCELHRDKSENSAKIKKYANWIKILKQIDGFITSRELNMLDKCISTYATLCSSPHERVNEIKKTIFLLLHGQSEINYLELLELHFKIDFIYEHILFELTEILLELEHIFYCSTSTENSIRPSEEKHFLYDSYEYYFWQKYGIDVSPLPTTSFKADFKCVDLAHEKNPKT